LAPESRKFLWDAPQAANRLTKFVDGKTFPTYQTNELLRSAVERQFEIIGESLRQLAAIDPETASRIIALPRIVAFRNVLIHGYATIDDKIVWGVVESNLPLLRSELEQLLP
jgi:uncharacterized protein with HEPN domain